MCQNVTARQEHVAGKNDTLRVVLRRTKNHATFQLTFRRPPRFRILIAMLPKGFLAINPLNNIVDESPVHLLSLNAEIMALVKVPLGAG